MRPKKGIRHSLEDHVNMRVDEEMRRPTRRGVSILCQNCDNCALKFPDCGRKKRAHKEGHCRYPWKPINSGKETRNKNGT